MKILYFLVISPILLCNFTIIASSKKIQQHHIDGHIINKVNKKNPIIWYPNLNGGYSDCLPKDLKYRLCHEYNEAREIDLRLSQQYVQNLIDHGFIQSKQCKNFDASWIAHEKAHEAINSERSNMRTMNLIVSQHQSSPIQPPLPAKDILEAMEEGLFTHQLTAHELHKPYRVLPQLPQVARTQNQDSYIAWLVKQLMKKP